jgi:CubicO group peptidase (beta-lactamase class C family)
VRIKDILQMPSGASWNEDYGDPESDISRFSRIFALGGSMNTFAATLEPELPPGSYNRYNSTDNQRLRMLLTNAVGRPILEYMTEMLWHPIGTENRATG